MTTGTNLQLQYDEATDSWSYENVNYEYPATGDNSWSGYTSPDPEFEFAPEEQEQEQENNKVCPPGYIYDESLKQCIPDANYQPPQWSNQPSPQSENRDSAVDPDNPLGIWIPPVQNADGTWIAGHYKQMPKTMAQFDAQDLFDWGLSKGYIDAQGNIIGSMQSTAPGWLGSIGQVGNDRQFNNWMERAKAEGMVGNVTGAAGQQIPGTIQVPLTTQISNIPGVFPGSYMADIWTTYAINSVKDDVETVEPYRGKSIVPAVTTGGGQQEFIDAAIKEEKLKQAKLDTERKERLVEREKAKDEGTGGSWGGDQEDRPVITPKSEPKGSKTGQTIGPAGMGSSPPKPKPKQSYGPVGGPRPGDR